MTRQSRQPGNRQSTDQTTHRRKGRRRKTVSRRRESTVTVPWSPGSACWTQQSACHAQLQATHAVSSCTANTNSSTASTQADTPKPAHPHTPRPVHANTLPCHTVTAAAASSGHHETPTASSPAWLGVHVATARQQQTRTCCWQPQIIPDPSSPGSFLGTPLRHEGTRHQL